MALGTSFKETGYKHIRGLIQPGNYSLFMKKLIAMGKGSNDKQVPGSTGFYKELIFEKLLQHLLPVIETETGYSLYKTYSYARQYNLGEELKRHTDRHACEITVSVCLENENGPWPIFVLDRDKNPHNVLLEAGDALIFKGVELPHWREVNEQGSCSQVFLHYVDQNGPYAAERDDMAHKGHVY